MLNNDCIVDTYRLFFETQGRKYGRNLSWSCMSTYRSIINLFREMKLVTHTVDSYLIL